LPAAHILQSGKALNSCLPSAPDPSSYLEISFQTIQSPINPFPGPAKKATSVVADAPAFAFKVNISYTLCGKTK
jgi:hypothetical protein